MKKLVLSMFAVAALASCVQNETINPGSAIDFGAPFVGNATKAIDYSYGENKLLKEIFVYGTVKGTAADPVSIFDYTRVWTEAANGDYEALWNCATTQYWIPGANYKFAAVAGIAEDKVTATDGIPTSLTFVSDGTEDLVAGYVEKNNVAATGNSYVAFTMKHLLSKAKFTINNITNQADDTKTSGYYYKVTDIKLTNAYTSGTCALTYNGTNNVSGAWTATGTAGVNFGHATDATTAVTESNATKIGDRVTVTSNHEYLIIPGNYTSTKLNVAFDIALYNSNDEPVNAKATKTAEVAVEFVAGYAYNFVLNLSIGQPINFTVTANPGWTNATPDKTIEHESTI